MKRIIIISVSLLITMAVVLRLAFNYRHVIANKNVSTDLNYVSVKVVPVSMLSLADSLQLTGYMEAIAEVDVPAEATGSITFLNADLGQVVSKGMVIATIDNTLKNLSVQKARNLRTKLEKDLERYRNLYNGGNLTQQQLDEEQNLYDDAVIQHEQAEKELFNTNVCSPITGTIIKKYVEKGEYINMGNPVVRLIDISKLKIELNVSETNVYKLNPRDNASISTDIYPGVLFSGSISFISLQGDDSHNYAVELIIPNDSKHPLKAGTFANAIIKLPVLSSAIYIPRSALIGSISNAEVYIASNNKAVRKKITALSANDEYVRVLSGLSVNDTVIVSGQINLAENKQIKIIK
jgi:membrane fusion protein, multidrug efflux system